MPFVNIKVTDEGVTVEQKAQLIKGATAGALVMLFAPTASMITSKIMPGKKAAAPAGR